MVKAIWLSLSLLAACSSVDGEALVDMAPPLAARPRLAPGVERPSLCERPADDAVRDVFCSTPPAPITSLLELQRALHVDLATLEPQLVDRATPLGEYDYSSHVSVLAHSTALAGHLVSPINPRVVQFSLDTAMAFQRGVQQVEVATRARVDSTPSKAFNFYLVRFEQACNDAANGCVPGDLFSPRVESGWSAVALRDDEDLKNTPDDCRQCHQRGRAGPTLLMRELLSPWTHFFELNAAFFDGARVPGVRGRDLVDDYVRAKGTEPYGGVPAEILAHCAALPLQVYVGTEQPLLFDSNKILDERWSDGQGSWLATPRPSATWQAAFDAFTRGEQLALPSFEQRPTDAQKQAQLTAAYQAHLAGALSSEQLPDLSDIFPDDPAQRAEIGLQTMPGATPAQTLIQACGSCHNDVLDQTISRARFNIDLARMPLSEVELAVARIELPSTAEGAMPPRDARQLDPRARAELLAYLRDASATQTPDPALQYAAQMGMARSVAP